MYLILLSLVLSSFAAFSKPIKLEKAGSMFHINIPDTYEFKPQLLGLENVILAPEDNVLGTSSLSITITGIKDTKPFNAKDMEASQKEYQTGRKTYIKDRGFTFVDFIPYAPKKSPQGHQIHTIGVVYTNGERITVDRTFMIECPESFIHAKFVGDVGLMKDLGTMKKKKFQSPQQQQLEKVILELTCHKKIKG